MDKRLRIFRRAINRREFTYWYFDRGTRHTMSGALALSYQRNGKATITTVTS